MPREAPTREPRKTTATKTTTITYAPLHQLTYLLFIQGIDEDEDDIIEEQYIDDAFDNNNNNGEDVDDQMNDDGEEDDEEEDVVGAGGEMEEPVDDDDEEDDQEELEDQVAETVQMSGVAAARNRRLKVQNEGEDHMGRHTPGNAASSQ